MSRKVKLLNAILLCTSCGVGFTPGLVKPGSRCPILGCDGHIKAYDKKVATISNTLDRAGHEVESITLCPKAGFVMATDIRFVRYCFFPGGHPKGFYVNLDEVSDERKPTRIIKVYDDVPLLDLDHVLAADELILLEWTRKELELSKKLRG